MEPVISTTALVLGEAFSCFDELPAAAGPGDGQSSFGLLTRRFSAAIRVKLPRQLHHGARSSSVFLVSSTTQQAGHPSAFCTARCDTIAPRDPPRLALPQTSTDPRLFEATVIT